MINTDILNEKSRLRTELEKELAGLSGAKLRTRSRAAAENFFRCPEWKRASWVLAFLSMGHEIETEIILEKAFEEKKTVGLPRIQGKMIVFLRVDSLEVAWDLHPYGIKEPPLSFPVLEPAEAPGPVLLVTPGLGFTRCGDRIGRGGGFYDKFLEHTADTDLKAWGFCFDFQVMDCIPMTSRDRRVDGIVTDKEIIIL